MSVHGIFQLLGVAMNNLEFLSWGDGSKFAINTRRVAFVARQLRLPQLGLCLFVARFSGVIQSASSTAMDNPRQKRRRIEQHVFTVKLNSAAAIDQKRNPESAAASELGANFVEPKADPFVILDLLFFELLPSLQDNKFLAAVTFARTGVAKVMTLKDNLDLDFKAAVLLSIDPRTLLGLCVRNLLPLDLHFDNNTKIADWLGLTCPPAVLPPCFTGKLAYDEHLPLEWWKHYSQLRHLSSINRSQASMVKR